MIGALGLIVVVILVACFSFALAFVVTVQLGEAWARRKARKAA